MSTASLQQIMREMARRMESLEQASPVYPSFAKPASEIEAYVSLDPVLADLYCQYLEARRQQIALARLRGENDPLTEVARDNVDSADCAVQTRLLELRRDRRTRALMTKRLTQSRHAADEVAAARRRQKQEAYHARFLQQQKKKLEKEAEDSFFILFVALMFLSQALSYTRRTLSMMHSFSNATYHRKALAVSSTAAA